MLISDSLPCRVVMAAFDQAKQATMGDIDAAGRRRSTMGVLSTNGVCNITNLSSFMHRSITLGALFHAFQEARKPGSALSFITPSPTRWRGYCDSIIRYLEIRSIFQEWVETEDKICEEDRRSLREKLVPEEEVDSLRALCYVLYAIKMHTLAAEDPKVPTGVIYLHIVEGIVDVLKVMAKS